MARAIILMLLVILGGSLVGCVSDSMVRAAIEATQAVWTPVPSQTPLATATPYPTLTPWPTYTPFPNATATREAVVLFAEDFETDETCFETGERPGGEVSVEDGALRMSFGDARGWVWSLCPEERFSEFVFEVDTTFEGSSQRVTLGVLFWANRTSPFSSTMSTYSFVISPDGYACLSFVELGNELQSPMLGCQGYEPRLSRASNHITVVAADNRIEAYVGDLMIGSLRDYRPHGGEIGLVALIHRGSGSEVLFDNVRISRP